MSVQSLKQREKQPFLGGITGKGFTSGDPRINRTRVVYEPEAAIVRRIFEEYAAGRSPREIVYALNAEQVLPPGARWKNRTKRDAATWSHTAIQGHRRLGKGILSNPLYIGQQVWHRSQWTRHPDSKKMRYRVRPKGEWVTHVDEMLRIIPQDLWDGVQAHLTSRHYSGIRTVGAGEVSAFRPALADELTRSGRRSLAITTDVADYDQLRRLVDAAVQTYGRIDVMINNAGLMPHSPLERLKIDDWERTIDVNLTGVLYGIAAALPYMTQQKSGHFINISSVAGHKVRPGSSVYAATKHAVRVISEELRMEVKPYNIRTTVISPGALATELPNSITEPDVAESVRKMTAQIGLPAETFARMVAFAMSQPEDVDVNEILFRPTRQEL